MKIKLLQIFANWNVLQKISGFEIEASSAIRLQRFLVAARQEYNLIEEQRVKLVNKYGITENDVTKVPKDKETGFWSEFNEILEQTVTIYDPQLSSSMLDGQRISAADFFAIAWLFDHHSYVGFDKPSEVANANLG